MDQQRLRVVEIFALRSDCVGPACPTASKRNRSDTSTVRSFDVGWRVANQQDLLWPRPGARKRGVHDVRIGLRRGRIVFCGA